MGVVVPESVVESVFSVVVSKLCLYLMSHLICCILVFRQLEVKPPAAMSRDIAMKTLGLCQVQGQGQNRGKAKTLNDYSEDDILHAFQAECKTLGKSMILL